MRQSSVSLFISVILLLVMLLMSCEENDSPEVVEFGSVTDIEQNVYRTVKIGGKWWMAEDLKVRTYRNGSSIRKSQADSLDWSTDSTGAYCEIYNDQQLQVGIYYNYHAVQSLNGLAPEGWHIPSDEEWKELEKYLGMNAEQADQMGWRGSNEGDALKVAAPAGWTIYESVWGTNKCGFSAEAKGCRVFNGGKGDKIFETGFWWTSSSVSFTDAYYRHLDYKQSNVYRSAVDMNYGFSVRCVKD